MPYILRIFFSHNFYFPAQLVGGFTLSDLLDKPWSQVSSLLPPGTSLQFLSRIGFIQYYRCSSIFIESCHLTLSRVPLINFCARRSPYEYGHSVRIELAKLVLVGTRISQATGDWCEIIQSICMKKTKTTPTWIILIHHTNTRKVNQGNLHHDWLLCNLQHDLQ